MNTARLRRWLIKQQLITMISQLEQLVEIMDDVIFVMDEIPDRTMREIRKDADRYCKEKMT